MLSFVNNHRYFIVQIETRVYIDVVGKGWHNYLDNKEATWRWHQCWNKPIDANFFWLFSLSKILKNFCYFFKMHLFVFLSLRYNICRIFVCLEKIQILMNCSKRHFSSKYLTVHKMFFFLTEIFVTAEVHDQTSNVNYFIFKQ